MTTEKLIDKTIRKWKKKLLIRKPVFWTMDFKIWKQLGGIKINFEKNDIFGSIHTPQNITFINLEANYNKEGMENTIVHELLHAKYNKLTEKQLDKKTKNLLRSN